MEYNKQYYRELAEKVESGEYFNEARDWYVKQYLQNFIERTYLIILMGGMLVVGFLVMQYYSDILPIKKSLPVKVSISNTADFSTRITYLGNADKNFDINEVLIKYFTKRFVESIESYDYRNDFKKLHINRKIIGTLASEDIINYYNDKISIRNRDSILLKFRKNIIRTINIKENIEVAKLFEEEKPSFWSNFSFGRKKYEDKIRKFQVTVNYDAIENNTREGRQTKTSWQSKIILSFQLVEYNFEEKEFTPLNFKVMSYESKKVN